MPQKWPMSFTHSAQLSEGRWYTVEVKDGSGVFEGNLRPSGKLDAKTKLALDVLESVILAHACAGVYVETKEYVAGIETALEAIENNISE